jgi:hypothetical protein
MRSREAWTCKGDDGAADDPVTPVATTRITHSSAENNDALAATRGGVGRVIPRWGAKTSQSNEFFAQRIPPHASPQPALTARTLASGCIRDDGLSKSTT